MIAVLSNSSPSIIFAAVAACFWLWAPAGTDRTDRVVLRAFAAAFAVGTIAFLLIPVNPIFTYIAFVGVIVPFLIISIGVPGVKVTKTMSGEWKKKRSIYSAGLLGCALILAIIVQHV